MSESSTINETPYRYTAQFANALEVRWQERWEESRAYRQPNPGDADFDASKPKFYCLDMFPYPSGAGLHVGHPEGYTATDIICRYKRMKGFNVLHPMGWDAFGLPAEQYAVQTGVHPAITTNKAIDNFRRQLKRFGFSYDWSREFATIDPDYYRWTQWIWLQAYHAWFDPAQGKARPIAELVAQLERDDAIIDAENAPKKWSEARPLERQRHLDRFRLAYLGEQTVNWCPKLGTVLANEEVIDGRSERGGFPVLRLPLKQWLFRITAYAERLLDDLAIVEWPESTRTMQAEWIGKSEGAEVRFDVIDEVKGGGDPLVVFTTRPDTLFGATYMVVAPEHPLVERIVTAPSEGTDLARLKAYVSAAKNRADVDRLAETKTKTGVFTGRYARNPATNEAIPIWTSDYVLMGYGTGAIMAVPAHDQRDFEFAQTFKLPIRQVVDVADDPWTGERATSGDGANVNSRNAEVSLNGLATPQAKAAIIAWLEEKSLGTKRVNYRLRDWLFSRQRYWGEPFPIVHDRAGMHHAVREAALPVILPELADYAPIESDTPVPPLGKARSWVETTAGAAGVDPKELPPDTPVQREVNTMPGWAGSCWYYLRFCSPRDGQRFVGLEAERYWMAGRGVDLYVGGAEHAVLHLLYARFWHKLLYDFGQVSTPEPFGKLFHQGLITSFAYQRADKSLVPTGQVTEASEGVFVETATSAPVTQVVAKMSKSLQNVVNPDDMIAEFGADTFRLYEMYMGPLEASKPWNTRDIVGVFRFLQRAWRLAIDERTGELLLAAETDAKVERTLHRTIQKVGEDIERLAFNTAIAALIELVNAATRPTAMTDPTQGGLTRDQLERFVRILAPFAPHMAEELWKRLGHSTSVTRTTWPSYDAALLVDDSFAMPVQVQGKLRARVSVPSKASAADIEKLVLGDAEVQRHVAGKAVKKVIVVPGKMVNLVIGSAP